MEFRAPTNHSMVVESKSSAIVEVCERVLLEVEANNFSQEDLFAVHLALQEAFANSIKHGNKMDPRKQVKVECSIDSDKIEICLTDEGDGFDPDSVPDPRHGQNVYKTEGRGLLLMHSYMDVVEFDERGSSVRMVRYKEKPRLT
jgi:serine/threonine-protein kinase RsbW